MEQQRNTSGFTADVERYGPNPRYVAKMYRDYVPQADIDKEILNTECVQGRGLPVPAYGGYLPDYLGCRTVLLEYIEGESAMTLLASGKAAPEELADDFARIHFQMHQCRAEGLETGRTRMERLLRLSEPNLGADLTGRCLRLLERCPDGDRLLHNDFHPGNMIHRPERGMICIDWSDAAVGDPLMDVARTVQMFDYGPSAASGPLVIPTDKISPEALERLGKLNGLMNRFIRRYEERYIALAGLSRREYDTLVAPWKVIVPASRFNIEWDCNKPAILKMMYQYFMANPVD